ncbi:MAG: hypothetical protein ACP5JU_02615 [Minisyncoccia bacterium]
MKNRGDKMKNNKYIESKFPTKEINLISVSERIALKPIYMVHRIFARRIGSVFRLIILSALKDEEVDIMEEYYKSHKNDSDTNNKLILDPMCGGGTTLIEGARLGAKVVGIEINPIPWFVAKNELTKVEPEELDITFKKLEKEVGKKIKDMYKTKCPYCGNDAETIYTFWIKKIECPYCKREIKLFKDYIVTYDKDEKNFTFVCPNCGTIFEKRHTIGELEVCPKCNFTFNPDIGVVANGHITCPHCNKDFKLIDVLKLKKDPPDVEPFAIDGWCPHCHKRFIKKFDDDDLKLLNNVINEFKSKKDNLLYPRDKIPDGYNTNQMKKHNYKYWYQMFNERQLLAHSLLLEHIAKIKDEKIREKFLLAFSENLRSNNMFCYYDKRWAKQNTPLFSRKDFAPVYSPLEQNIWGSRFGRGTFIQVYRRMYEGNKYLFSPFERRYDSKIIKKIELDETINENQWELYCEDAQNLDNIIKKDFDLVVTDPPYFDSINYSEVYDFFYVWLKQVLNYPCFKKDSTKDPNEIIVNKIQNKNIENYKQGLINIFEKSTKKLKNNGLFIFTFHDIDEKSWKDMLDIVKRSGLYVKKIHFYHGENVSGGHFGGQKTVFDSIWVCKKGIKDNINHISIEEAVGKIWIEIENLISSIKSSKYFKLDENDLKIFIYGKTIEIMENYKINTNFEEIIKIILNDDRFNNILLNKNKKIDDYIT